jgi:hypothetical protein
MSKWQKTEAQLGKASETIASQADLIAELQTRSMNPGTGESERRAIEAEIEATTLRQENLRLKLDKALEKCPNVAKGVAAGKLDLEQVPTVDALFNLEATLQAIVSESTPPAPAAAPAATPPASDNAGQPAAPKSGEEPTPPDAGPIAAPADEPAPVKTTIAASQREAIQRGVDTGDFRPAIEEFFPETKE